MGTTCSRAGTPSADSYWEESRKRKPAFSDINSAAEVLYHLSVFGFSRLSDNDQIKKTEEIQKKIVQSVIIERFPGESEVDFRFRTFTVLFKKLQFPEQNLFLSRVMKKFKRERKFGELISWYTQLDGNDQLEELGKLVHVTEEETNKDFRLARFTQIARDYTDYVHKRIWRYYYEKRNDNDESPEWLLVTSRFSEIFQGFSIIWFKGQCASNQRMLIEELSRKETGEIEKLCELSKDIRLETFTELCKKVVDFRIQVEFIENAEEELRLCTYLPCRQLLEPQDFASACELLQQLSTFGFSLLSYQDQQDRMYWFFRERREVIKYIEKKFLNERRLCESILLFGEVGSNDKQEIMETLSERLWDYDKEATKDVMIKRISEESEEDFRLRRFIMLCCVNLSLRDLFIRSESEKWDIVGMLQKTSDDHEEIAQEIKSHSRYAEFYLGVSIIWFKARCANNRRNPIQLQLSNDICEKHPNESTEDFRLRRFTESFKQLPFISQEYLVKYIHSTLLQDLGPGPLTGFGGGPEGRSSFDLEFIKVKAPSLRGVREASASTQVIGGATTRGGGQATTDGATVTSSSST